MDVNTLAYRIVQQSLGEEPIKPRPTPEAIARGKARMKSLPEGQAKVIAQQGAEARWASKRKGESKD